MKPLFEVNAVDREYYAARIRDFLPDRLIDIHTHVWLDRFKACDPHAPARTVSWPSLVTKDCPLEDLEETYRLLLPGKRVVPMFFSNLASEDDVDGANAYASECSMRSGYPALIFAAPQWSAQSFENRILAGGFVGAKVYMTMADRYIPAREMRIFDYLPHHQLKILDRHGWIAMLHIPRDGRLKDAVNLAQMLEIERRYPNVQVIIAHVGRAYCREDVGDAFDVLASTRRMRFDFSANTNAEVFEMLIRAVGPARILFGSDMPILRMRMRRICKEGRYINLVPRGLYGDISGDCNMREVDGAEAESLSFFMYEELDAFRRAAEATGLQQKAIEDIFYNNAAQMLHASGFGGAL
jgi:hypothetical protein